MPITRRQMLLGLTGLSTLGLAGAGARYWLQHTQQAASPAPGYDYELIAMPHALELVPGHQTPAWTYNGQPTGLELRAKQGDWLRVRFINRLPDPTTVHWHGIRLPLEMDGVPYISQLPVLPGESFDYRFQVPDAGSFWYHPHTASTQQLGRGLVGPLIVEEREPTGFIHERVLNLKSWHVDDKGAFTDFLVPREAARGGTPGRLSTVNGQHAPVLDVPAGQIVRLRLLNLDNTLTYRISLPELEARIYAVDGNPVLPQPLGEAYWLGPGMRLELAVRVPSAGTEASLRNGPLRLATLRAVAHSAAPAGDWPPALPANPIAEPDLARAERLRFNFEWVGSSMLASTVDATPSLWQINGRAWRADDKSCTERPLATLKKGQSYIFDLRNMTQYQHPIHLHGMTFKVLGSNRRSISPYFTDTFLLGRNETAQIALVADNPGTWMFHCHVVDHMETGLMGAIAVA